MAERAEARENLVRHPAQQLGDPGEGEHGLGLDRAMREDSDAAYPSPLESRLP